jgi:hypothetical protein
MQDAIAGSRRRKNSIDLNVTLINAVSARVTARNRE